ncbi:MAG: Sensor protein [uncultured bacterium]|nr:MAG: Sensor protein [uncultured bacterium]
MHKILFVEDDPMIAEIYQRKLASIGIEVVIAKTGKEVFKYLDQDKFDLILLDLILPEMNGVDVLKEIRSNEKYDKDLKIIVFSNLGEEEAKNKVMESGANKFISKMQYTPSDFAKEMQRLLREYEEQDKNKIRLNGETEKNGKGKILLIEDEEIFLDMFGKKLEDDGYEVVRAKNGAWGVKEVMNGNYDLIVTDMVMPAMGGEEIITKLKQEDKTKNIPIIVLSASIDDESAQEVRKLGVSEFFLKTHIVPSDLSRKANELLGNK